MTGRPPDPWGAAAPPLRLPDPLPPLPARLARLAEVERTGTPILDVDVYAEPFPSADELPEVQVLAADGWRPVTDGPVYALLPAAWPASHRTWVPDRLPKVAIGGTTAGYYGAIESVGPPDPDDGCRYRMVDDDARAAGLPAPPRGRIWLLRSPWPALPVAAIYELVWAVGDSEGADAGAIYRAGRTVFSWDEKRALARCPRPTATLVRQWAAAGRVGEAAGRFVERRWSPSQFNRFAGGTGLAEDTALAWLDSLAADDVDAAAGFVGRWRAQGLPGNPPPAAHRFAHRDPAELRAWLAAGFDLYAAHQLGPAGLERALHWRRAGFTPAHTYEQLRRDRFGDRPHRRCYPEWDELPDPPGRRGRRARRWARDDDPWTNTD